jgi:maltose/moltooligosaccharide transporter
VVFDSILFGKVAQKHGAKMVHFGCLYWELLLFILPVIQNQYLFCCVLWIWNRMGKYDGIPYLMAANIPKERYGVYMESLL